LYALKINCKGKRSVRKANKGINIEKYNSFKTLKIKIIRKRKEEKWKKKEKRKKRNSTELQSPMQKQSFIRTTKSVTEYTHIHIHPLPKSKSPTKI